MLTCVISGAHKWAWLGVGQCKQAEGRADLVNRDGAGYSQCLPVLRQAIFGCMASGAIGCEWVRNERGRDMDAVRGDGGWDTVGAYL